MSLRDNMVSMALDENGFQDLMTVGDIHRVKDPLLDKDCSNPAN